MTLEGGKDYQDTAALTNDQSQDFLKQTMDFLGSFSTSKDPEAQQDYVDQLYGLAPAEAQKAEEAADQVEAYGLNDGLQSPKETFVVHRSNESNRDSSELYPLPKETAREWRSRGKRQGVFAKAFTHFLEHSQDVTVEQLQESLQLLPQRQSGAHFRDSVPLIRQFVEIYPRLDPESFGPLYSGLIGKVGAVLRAEIKAKADQRNPEVAEKRKTIENLTQEEALAAVNARVESFFKNPEAALMSAEDFETFAGVPPGRETLSRVALIDQGALDTGAFDSVHNALSQMPSNLYRYAIQTHCDVVGAKGREKYILYFPLLAPRSECQKVEVTYREIHSQGYVDHVENGRWDRRVTRERLETSTSPKDAAMALQLGWMKLFRPGFAEANQNSRGSLDYSQAIGAEPSQVIQTLLGRDYVRDISMNTQNPGQYRSNTPQQVQNFFLNNYDPAQHVVSVFASLSPPGAGGFSIRDVDGKWQTVDYGRLPFQVVSVNKPDQAITLKGPRRSFTLNLESFSKSFEMINIGELVPQKILPAMDQIEKETQR